MGAVKRYPVSEWAKLVYKKDWNFQEVAEKYGVSATVVRDRLYRKGHPTMHTFRKRRPASKRLTEAQVKMIKKERTEGKTWGELAVGHGMTADQLRSTMRHQCKRRRWKWPIPIKGDY